MTTSQDKLTAAIAALSEDDIEDFVLEHSPRFRRMIARSEAERAQGRVIPVETYVARSSLR